VSRKSITVLSAVHLRLEISAPAVLEDRAFNSLISVTKAGLLVQGTRYGTRAELEASQAHILLRDLFEFKLVDIKIKELDWLASIIHWATDEINTISGGIVSPSSTVGYFLLKPYTTVYFGVYEELYSATVQTT
jgi:hypothetical protein